jgi:hypothetical protein
MLATSNPFNISKSVRIILRYLSGKKKTERRRTSTKSREQIFRTGLQALSEDIKTEEDHRYLPDASSRYYLRSNLEIRKQEVQRDVIYSLVLLIAFLAVSSIFVPESANALEKILPTATFILGRFFPR